MSGDMRMTAPPRAPRSAARSTTVLPKARAGIHLVGQLFSEGTSRSQRAASHQHTRFYQETWAAAARELGLAVTAGREGWLEVDLGPEKVRLSGSDCSIDGPDVLGLAGDKPRVYAMLHRAGLPAPAHQVFTLAELGAAGRFVEATPGACVVKPARNSAMGKGVTTGIRTMRDLERAAVAATAAGARVLRSDPRLYGLVDVLRREVPLLVERQVPGVNYRLLFLDGQLIDAIRREPPSVTGDGRTTVEELISSHNESRLRAGGRWAQRLITRDLELERSLERQGLSLSARPADGLRVVLKAAVNETSPEDNHPAHAELCDALVEQAAVAVATVGARLAGVDVITDDPGRPLAEGRGCILEVNTTPGLAMHLHGHPGAIDPAVVVLDHLAGDARRRSGGTATATAGGHPDRPPVILLGGAMNALSIARSLGDLGVAVHTVGVAPFVERSRHVQVLRPPARDDPSTSWAACLLGPETYHLRGAVVLAASDVGLDVVARYRDDLLRRFRMDECNPGAQAAMLNKLTTYEHAVAAGVPTPRFWRINDREDIAKCRDELVFPLIVKPLFSHEYQRLFPGLTKFRVVDGLEDLESAYTELSEAGLGVLLVECIPGPDDLLCSYYTYLDHTGAPTFDFTKRVLRRYPPGNGPACYHLTDRNPEVRDIALRLFKQVGLRGVANAEFKRDVRDGRLKLIECNARFTAADALLAAAGIDLARYVYLRVIGAEPKPPERYRTGLRMIHHMIDLRAFLELRRRGDLRLRTWLGSLAVPQTFSTFRWTDPVPALVRSEIGDRIRLIREYRTRC